MAWFKKKISYEQFWIELYGGYLFSDFSLADSLRILGSDMRLLNVSIDSVLSDLGLSKFEMARFGRVVALGSTCAVIDHFDKGEFWRFKLCFEHSEEGRELQADLERYDIPVESVLSELSVSFMSGDVSSIDSWILSRSELFGDAGSMLPNNAALFRQANVLTSFLLKFCRINAPVPFGLMLRRTHEARDQVVSTLGTLVRARERMLANYKLV